ncbi:MAG: ThuA domain-containing protein [Candidatus Hydrogenedentes bacterium]|nr:ThuA domain-containing protein [Candidatus Hydrogenedentota bacterium]
MNKKRVLILIGGQYHPFESCANLLKGFVEAAGRHRCEISEDRDRLKARSINRFDAVILYTQGGELEKTQLEGLLNFVKKGGGCVGIHGAAASWQKHDAYVDFLGGTFASHGPIMEFPVTITSAKSVITQRIQNFRVTDELYTLDKFDPKTVEILATASWHGKAHPVAYRRTYGAGRVFYLALGHDERAFGHAEFQKMAIRGLDWTLRRPEREPLTSGVIGYGGAFNMGRMHLQGLRDAAGFQTVAVCELDAARRQVAEQENPGIKTYPSVSEMLRKSDVELLVVITPHESHARLALQCLKAGRHVIMEKPFCLTVKEADAMIEAASKNRRMLSVFHNRRWDGDYMTIKDVIQRGLLGDVFHIELAGGGYHHPGYWWRSHKPISGGGFYDWGAHFVDWVLGLVPAKLTEISGHFQDKRVWHDVTNEDHCNAVLRFGNGCCANIELSSLAAVNKRRWRILGTKGGLEDVGDNRFRLVTFRDGVKLDSFVAYQPGDWQAYYRNIGDHLTLDEPLAVTPESARRVIGVIETAEKSSRARKAVPAPREWA